MKMPCFSFYIKHGTIDKNQNLTVSKFWCTELYHYSIYHNQYLYQHAADAGIICAVLSIWSRGTQNIHKNSGKNTPECNTSYDRTHAPQYLLSESVKLLIKLSTVLFIHTDSYIHRLKHAQYPIQTHNSNV